MILGDINMMGFFSTPITRHKNRLPFKTRCFISAIRTFGFKSYKIKPLFQQLKK